MPSCHPLLKTVLLCVPLIVSGCKEVLYSDLSEVETNEMVAILEASGISATRSSDKDDRYTLLIEAENVGAATMILKSEGYPKKKFKSIGDIFAAEGIVGTPFEERVRYMYALDEKLAEHLSSIDGIRDARVSITIPERSRFDQTIEPSKASVILHHEKEFDAQSAVPKIKTLVANSVQGLEYDKVAVVVFLAGGATVKRMHQSFTSSAANAHSGDEMQPSLAISDRTFLEVWWPVGLLGLVCFWMITSVFRVLSQRLGLRWLK
ncbi:MAG: type III secretion inner membrane ring lipoprotein SctJ [Pseudomonadota bacterium]